jgi:dihydroorotase
MKRDSLTLRQPDDWHLHLRDGAMLAQVVGASARDFARAVIMPNLVPPVTSARAAAAYRERIRACLPPDSRFEPLMTAYLTDATDATDLIAGARDGVFVAAKLYPAGATTHAAAGVTDIAALDPVLEAMSLAGLPLSIHGEVVDRDVDVFDREAVFIERELEPLRRRHPELRVVLEHISTRAAVAYVGAADPGLLGATVTPHHLAVNRNAMFEGGIRPHYYCLPVVKREADRRALVAAVTSGDPHYFLGTDSAPHARAAKESACGCAGIFNAPVALATYCGIFERADALARFEAFAALNGPRFYRLPVNERTITLVRDGAQASDALGAAADVEIFAPPVPPAWRVLPA